MARSFLYNVLTLDGAALIARATAANPLVITGTKSCTLAASSDTDLASKPLSWYDGRTGAVHSVSASSNAARIDARYEPEGTRQTLKTVCILAKIDGDEESVILCAKSDPNADITLPGEGDISQALDFEFILIVNADGEIEVTPGASASQADLDRLVSAHVAGDPSQGEAQTVHGAKTFTGTLTFHKLMPDDGATTEAHAASIGDATHALGYINVMQADTGTLNCTALAIDQSVEPMDSDVVDVGSVTKKFKNAHLSGDLHLGGDVYLGGRIRGLPHISTSGGSLVTPIGSIIMGTIVPGVVFGDSSAHYAGETMTASPSARILMCVSAVGSPFYTSSNAYVIEAGTWVLLSCVAGTSSSSDYTAALLQRIA